MEATKTINDMTAAELETALLERRETERVVAKKKRDDYEALRENTILELTQNAQSLSAQINEFKNKAFGDLGTLYALLQDYSSRQKDGKGNFTIESANGLLKIKFAKQDLGIFDERSVQAEKHILEFINKEFEGKENTKKLILSLLERKKGSLDIKLVQRLYTMENDFNDENWHEGIRLLKESWQSTSTKDYVTFYMKDEHNMWQLINLNFASI